MSMLIAKAEWGGRPSTSGGVAAAVERMLSRFPVPEGVQAAGWSDLDGGGAVPSERPLIADLVDRHVERDRGGAVLPLAGWMFTLAQGDGSRSDSAYVSIGVTAGCAVGGARIAANSATVMVTDAWASAASRTDRLAVLDALVHAWHPAWAVVQDRALMRARPRVPERTPWPGYATWFSDSLVPDVVLPDDFAVTETGGGRLAVLGGEWDPQRVAGAVPAFLDRSTYRRIPERETADA